MFGKDDNYIENSSRRECCKNCMHSNGLDYCSAHMRLRELPNNRGICDLYDKNWDCFKTIKDIREETGCDSQLAKDAIEYIDNHYGQVTIIGFIKAKMLAVATPGLTFDERVLKFSNMKEDKF